MATRSMVVGAVMVVNLLVIGGRAASRGVPYADPAFIVINLLFTGTPLGIILTKRKWLAGALLVVMLSLYWLPGAILGWLGR